MSLLSLVGWVLWLPLQLLMGISAAALILCLVLRWRAQNLQAQSKLTKDLQGKESVAFFHPYAHAGGGGERVLWCAIRAVQQQHSGVACVVYTGDTGVKPEEFLAQAKKRFGVELDGKGVHFAYLTGRRWVDAASWPRFTLIGQSIGSMMLGWEALCLFRPSIYIDSMGYAFTLPLFALLGGCSVGCYVHYPTISTDMLQNVRERGVGVCNDALVARSRLLSTAKLLYYQMFAFIYGLAGKFAEVVLCNSSWTQGHINAIWRVPHRTSIVYPPCDTAALAALPLERGPKDFTGQLVLSLAQFRPEKNHALQLRAFARFLRETKASQPTGNSARIRLILAGGCRDLGDRQRVEALRQVAAEEGMRERGPPPVWPEGSAPHTSASASISTVGDGEDWDVNFRTNVPIEEMMSLLGQADVGIHTMRDEHFGISVVEFMAAGAVVLAHNSAGPAMDIVTPLPDGRRTGLLATDEADYAAKLKEALCDIDSAGRLKITKAAREAVRYRFDQKSFEDAIASRLIAPLRRPSDKKRS
eukprot:TRINITY_DN89495_c0_g1_i1.p1 TRINITY_DN89495_c0_g1~~TRINITY_DN89495_c0_g1_i1.p1  ORF type:complete len:548 (-),score=94.23 TRINITY_DN89495_c0_g1_i1:81-1670(-)